MNQTLSNTFKIIAVILFLIALGIGGWFIYSRFFGQEAGPSTQTQQTEVLVWGLWETQADFQVLADAYQASHPNIKITYIEREAADYQATTLGRISSAGSQAPDIVMIHNSWRSEYQPFLGAMPSSVMTANDYQNTFYDTVYNDFKGSDGQIYGIPLGVDTLGLYYNKDLLEAEGYTAGPEDNWEQLIEQAEQLTKKDSTGKIEIAGLAMGTSSNVEFAPDIVNLLMLQEGAIPVNSDGTSGLTKDAAAERALEFYTNYSTKKKLWDDTMDRDIQMFAEGRLAMMFAPSWRVHDILSAKNEFLKFDVAPVPQLSNLAGEKVNWATYWGFGVAKSSPRQSEAWDFLKFASQPDQLKAYYSHVAERDEARAFGEIYPRRDMASELEGQQYVSAYVEMVQNGAQSWEMKKADTMNQALVNSIDRIVKGESNAEDEVTSISTIYNGLGSGGGSSSSASISSSSGPLPF